MDQIVQPGDRIGDATARLELQKRAAYVDGLLHP